MAVQSILNNPISSADDTPHWDNGREEIVLTVTRKDGTKGDIAWSRELKFEPSWMMEPFLNDEEVTGELKEALRQEILELIGAFADEYTIQDLMEHSCGFINSYEACLKKHGLPSSVLQ